MKINIPSLLSLFVLLFANSNAGAVSQNKVDSLILAMLDGKSANLLIHPKKNKTNKKPKPKKVVTVYPRNCMTWNKAMILNKSKQYDKIIYKNAKQYKVDANLIRAVITAESCFRKKALSTANAKGLMQLIPATAERFGVNNSYDPKQNIRGGTKYLRFLLDRFKGNLSYAIAGYNAGEGRVDQYKGIPPYKETKQYVKNVMKVYDWLKPKPKAKLKPKAKKRVKVVYRPPKIGNKAGRQGWQYNRRLAPHLYK